MQISDILSHLDQLLPFATQEDYDNSGLIVGDPSAEVNSALICLDVTEEIMEEAIRSGCDLLISHHPMVFSGLKKLNGKSMTERLIASALKNNVAVLALHTNLDNYSAGVNSILCEKLGILNPSILRPLEGKLRKLVTFCPLAKAEELRSALFDSGAGHIGNYDACSYNIEGQGTFRALEGANPFVGKTGELHTENETRIEVIYPVYIEGKLLNALLSSHPYEEVAFDIYPLANNLESSGAGMIGYLPEPTDPEEFLLKVKNILQIPCIRHTSLPIKKIRKIALCGGSGAFLIKDAIAAKADLYITGDIKYHDFFIPENRMILADVGHHESEQFTKELIFTLLKKKFPTFALQISKLDSNPVKYL
ncbi:MAG: Nif3-like dinuclear metal center hexameric protein [Bacteroidales bacterium]|nr:Nif3-like dinuclear metal center hexameric protein [Bacteroidales bacterium]